MKILLQDIPEQGLFLNFEENGLSASDFDEQATKIISSPQADLFLKLSGGEAMIRGTASVELQLICARCLQSFSYTIKKPINITCKPNLETENEIVLDTQDLEVYFIDNDEIDLTNILKDELALQIPFSPKCQEQCPGLCMHCGQLKGSCACQDSVIDPRWGKLKGLLPNKK